MKSAKTQKIEIKMHVAHVGSFGNIVDGRYFYSCSPKIVNVTEKDALISFKLSDDTDDRFKIENIFFTDLHAQVKIAKGAGPGGSRDISVEHKNKVQSLTFFSILVRDHKLNIEVNCDPQATNVPPPKGP